MSSSAHSTKSRPLCSQATPTTRGSGVSPPPSLSRPAAAHARSDGVSAAGPGGQGREGAGGGGGRGQSPGSPLRTITRAGLGGATLLREVRAGLPGPVRRARAAGQAGPAQPGAGRRPWLGRTLRRGGPRRPAGGRSPRAGTRPCILRDGGPRERPNGTSTFRKPLQFLLFVTRSCVAQAGLRSVSHNAELQSECENSLFMLEIMCVYCVHACARVARRKCRGQRTTFKKSVLPPCGFRESLRLGLPVSAF